jgi:DNA-directed RNA polymerase specialized sigma24 family protein
MIRPLTDSERRAIVDRYTRGQSLAYISMALDRSRETIKAVLAAAKVPIRRQASPNRNWGWTGMG